MRGALLEAAPQLDSAATCSGQAPSTSCAWGLMSWRPVQHRLVSCRPYCCALPILWRLVGVMGLLVVKDAVPGLEAAGGGAM